MTERVGEFATLAHAPPAPYQPERKTPSWTRLDAIAFAVAKTLTTPTASVDYYDLPNFTFTHTYTDGTAVNVPNRIFTDTEALMVGQIWPLDLPLLNGAPPTAPQILCMLIQHSSTTTPTQLSELHNAMVKIYTNRISVLMTLILLRV